jgi:hypothetical protein
MQLTEQSIFSRLSLVLSSLCIIHCLSIPIIVILLPALAGFLSSTVETIIILLIVPISAIGFFPTWRKHQNGRLLAGYLVAITIMLTSHFVFHNIDLRIHAIESILLIIGSVLLAFVIYKNNKHTHVCKNPHHVH